MPRAVNLAASFALISTFVSALASAPIPKQNLYLLAGTPTINSPKGFPARLYRVAGGRLVLVRQIGGGLMGVADDLSGHLYVFTMGPLSVIHERVPEEVDVIPASRGGATAPCCDTIFRPWGAISGPGVAPSIVFAYDADHWTIARVFADAAARRPRVVRGDWDLYAHLRYAGAAGGPYTSDTGPSACIVAHFIAVMWGGDYTYGLGVLAAAPPSLPPTAGLVPTPSGLPPPKLKTRWGAVVADTARFFLFHAPPQGGELRPPMTVYVLNKETGRWATVEAPYYDLAPRLFGAWLATTVQEPNPEGRVSPGLNNERSSEVDDGPVRELPRVRGMYPTNVYMPGKLLLQNLVNGQKVTIDTGQQDSEVLGVRKDGLVLYRVNDEIFSAQIEGDKVSTPTLVVKGEDVPEVHWAFWSNAPATPAPSGRPRTGK